MKFQESAIAHRYLDGLEGLEIGGSAHNPFGLNTINVDKFDIGSPGHLVYAVEQFRLCGEVLPVDVVAPGDHLPFEDKSFDFILSSHVIEHFWDPIAALKEWARVARRYIFIVCPHRDAHVPDREKPITPWQELLDRHAGILPDPDIDDHHTRWTPDTFAAMCANLGLPVVEMLDPDDKVDNGFTVIIDLQKSN